MHCKQTLFRPIFATDGRLNIFSLTIHFTDFAFIPLGNHVVIIRRKAFGMMETYREEIDGMRALAVISVILFHAGFTICPGGYVGVDVFFVISGYLITSIILAEHEQERFSLTNFYERRARRILPALFLVVFCSIPFAFSYLLYEQLRSFAQAVISVTLCSSNVFFWMKEEYFNTDTELNPLVHTWSLAIEEQFYILFSLLFVVFSRSQYRLIQYLLIFISLISLVLAQWSGNLQLTYPFISPDPLWFSQRDWASFYLLTGRVWELLFGALAAFYLRQHSLQKRLLNEIGAALGLLLILFAIFGFNKETPFPSFHTLVPTGGTVLLILCGNQNTWTGRLLSVKVFTMIGLCSYSAYLWHQPLLAFAKVSSIEKSLNLQVRVGVVVLSLGLAYVSWWFVERPFRNKTIFSRRQIVGFALGALFIVDAIMVALLSTSKLSMISNLAKKGNYKTQPISTDDFLLDLETMTAHNYRVGRFHALERTTSYNQSSPLKRLVLIGDSHAHDFANIAAENNKLTNYQIRVGFILHECQIYISTVDRSSFMSAKDKASCHNNHDIRSLLPLIRESDVVILAVYWKIWAAQHISETVSNLQLRKNQTLIVVGSKKFSDTYPLRFKNTSYVERQKMRYTVDEYHQAVNRELLKQLNSDVFVDMQRLICGRNSSCPVFTPEDRLYSNDGSHTTPSGAKFVGAVIFSHPPLKKL